jgi:hypothetical protein
MTIKTLAIGALVIALLLPLGACMESVANNGAACPPGTHWESLPNQSDTQQGYRCAPNA